MEYVGHSEVDVEEYKTWLADATTFDTAKDSLDAMSKTTKEIENIDDFFSSNREAVPDSIKQDFVPREHGGTLLGVSLLEELAPVPHPLDYRIGGGEGPGGGGAGGGCTGCAGGACAAAPCVAAGGCSGWGGTGTDSP